MAHVEQFKFQILKLDSWCLCLEVLARDVNGREELCYRPEQVLIIYYYDKVSIPSDGKKHIRLSKAL